nr:hypothetical protein [Burkholderia metallica]
MTPNASGSPRARSGDAHSERFSRRLLFPASGEIAERRFELVVIAHCMEAGVDSPFFAGANFVDHSFHVVVNAATYHSAERDEGAGGTQPARMPGLSRALHAPLRGAGATHR